jgi:sugar phosphate permease
MALGYTPARIGGETHHMTNPSAATRAPLGLVAAAVILLLTGVLDGLDSRSSPFVTQTFAGPRATGRWMESQNAVGNVAGMTAPVVTGYLVQRTGHYTSALIVSGRVALCGLVAWRVIVPGVRPIDRGAERALREGKAVRP